MADLPVQARPTWRWTTAGQKVIGAQHAKAGKPNQDHWAAELLEGGLAAVMAVSDGHGSDHCFRSDVGAGLAVTAALDLLSMVTGGRDQRAGPGVGAKLLTMLPQMLTHKWLGLVRQHLREHPFSVQEWGLLRPPAADPADASASAADPTLLAYGATLLAVAATQDYALFVQLGDGEILVVGDGSKESDLPLPTDAALIANETTSLCMPNAHARFRCALRPVGEAPPRLILACTDGYPNSFETQTGFRQVGPDIRDAIVRKGLDAVEADLEGWLEQASREGSGDDCTLALIWREDQGAAA